MLGPAAGASTATLVVFAPGEQIVPLGAASAVSSATLALTAAGRVRPRPASAISSATLALTAKTRVVLGTASVLSSGTLARTAETRVSGDERGGMERDACLGGLCCRWLWFGGVVRNPCASELSSIVALGPASAFSSAALRSTSRLRRSRSSPRPFLQRDLGAAGATRVVSPASPWRRNPCAERETAGGAGSIHQRRKRDPGGVRADGGVRPSRGVCGPLGASLVVFAPTVTFVALETVSGVLAATLVSASSIPPASGCWTATSTGRRTPARTGRGTPYEDWKARNTPRWNG